MESILVQSYAVSQKSSNVFPPVVYAVPLICAHATLRLTSESGLDGVLTGLGALLLSTESAG